MDREIEVDSTTVSTVEVEDHSTVVIKIMLHFEAVVPAQ